MICFKALIVLKLAYKIHMHLEQLTGELIRKTTSFITDHCGSKKSNTKKGNIVNHCDIEIKLNFVFFKSIKSMNGT